jgi:hypothetical protein
MFILLIGGQIEQAVGRALGITRESEVPEEKDEA